MGTKNSTENQTAASSAIDCIRSGPSTGPLDGTLLVTIEQAAGLVNVDRGLQGVSDPYVEVLAKIDANQILKLHTVTVQNCLNPVFNDRFSIIVDGPATSVDVSLMVFDEDTIGDDEPMGQVALSINSGFPFGQFFDVLLKPIKQEKVSGYLRFCVEYRPGERVDVNQKHNERIKKKKEYAKLPKEVKENLKEWRLQKDIFTEGEEIKMALLGKIFQENFGYPSDVFAVTTKKQLMFFEVKQAAYQVSENRNEFSHWQTILAERDGDFVNEAKQMIKDVCDFQSAKKESFRDGYINDPESLFCEEIKSWASTELSSMKLSSKSAEVIEKRVAYYEQCLLVPGLFDAPSTIAKSTVQKLILKVRSILKYRALHNIEKELSHEDATRAFGELKNYLNGLVFGCVEFLKNVFTVESKTITNADKFIMALESDPNIKEVISNNLLDIRNRMNESKDGKDVSWERISCGPQGLKKTLELLDPLKLKDPKDPVLREIFKSTTESGVEEWFRGNPYIAMKFLRAHSLVLETGRLYVVIEKASNLAKTGGTLLVYGIGNAHLNSTLDATVHIMEELKKEINEVAKIAECCFEDLVYSNMATSDRTQWISKFKTVFPAIRDINGNLKEILKAVAHIKLTANSVSMMQRIEKTAEEQKEFVESAEEFSKRMCQITGVPYKKPEPKPITEEGSEAWKKLLQVS